MAIILYVALIRRSTRSHLVDLNDADHILPTDGANVDLVGTGHAGTDMPAVIKQRILLLRVADLAEIHLLVGDFPVADAFAVTFAVLVATDVPVAGLAFHEGALAVALVVDPVAVIRVAGRILHQTLPVTLSEDEVAGVSGARVRDVRSLAVVVAFVELAAVVVTIEGGVDCLGTGEGTGGVVARRGPDILDEEIRAGEETGSTQLGPSGYEVSIVHGGSVWNVRTGPCSACPQQ